MASAEENVECRRTRSGRKVSITQPASTPRSNRRSTRKQTQDEQIELESDIVAGENKERGVPNAVDCTQKELCDITRQESTNSIEDQVIYEDIAEPAFHQQTDEGRLMDAEMYAAHEDAEVPVSLDGGIDEKSSSFPFGVMGGHSETSDDAQNDDEISGSENTAVENSLLASLAGDNANSLPSVGGGDENEIKKNFDSKVIQSMEGKCEKLNSSDESVSQPAIAEDLGDGETSNATIVNTELVSEDELPAQSKVNYTEEVSDEELPAPKRAELPADAEVISEDELPPRKSPGNSPKRGRSVVKINIYSTSTDSTNALAQKRKTTELDPTDKASDSKPDAKKLKNEEQYNPMSPTSESDDTTTPVEKKAKLESCESEDNEIKKEKDVLKEKEKKRLPDLDKYWRVVKEDPADFTGWTYLLQYVDNESDAEAAREAYDKFLSHYPYCYGYWRKYADYEKRKGIKANSNAVFERGLDAIPLSVDLWIHYLTHIKSNHSDNEAYIRSQFERATSACGLEFRSDKLWDAYIKWEMDGKHYQHVLAIYDRLLSIPTHGYSGHFDSFHDFISQHDITSLIGSDELHRLINEIRDPNSQSRSKSNSRRCSKEENDGKDNTDNDDGFAGDSNEDQESDSKEDGEQKDCHSRLGPIDVGSLTDEELVAIKDKVVAARRKLHKATVAAVTARWAYEEGIKRPYFHVKPLERSQLKNWNDYLDFEIEKGDRKRIIVLFERCLIACALYDEFWLKMIRYLESIIDEPGVVAITSDVFQRACEIHHPDKPSLHLMWAAFEECQSNFDRAATILVNLEKKCPNLLQVAYRRINVERRRGDFDKCKELYEHYIAHAKNKTIAGSLSIKYARFLNKICKDLSGGLKVLSSSLEKDPANTRVALQMIDLALQRDVVDEEEVVQIMDKFMARENMDPEQKVLFAQRKVEFLEDFGSTAQGLQDAQRALQLTLNKANEAKKKRESSPSRKMAKETTAAPNSSGQTVLNNGSVGAVNNTGYYGASNSVYYGQQNSGGYQQQAYDGYYNQWQYGSGYGYGQWGGYGNYY